MSSSRVDLYAVLGIERHAGPETVRRAYRKRAKAAHPDAGGHPKEWEMVSTALRVLSDPKARNRYDRTGEFSAQPEPDTEQARVLSILASVIESIVCDPDIEDVQLVTVDMVQGIRSRLKNGRDNVVSAIVKLYQERTRWTSIAKRWHGKHAPFVEGVIRAKMQTIDQAVANNEQQLADIDKAEAMLEELRFDHSYLWSDTAIYRTTLAS